MINLAFVGAGRMANAHATILQKIPDCSIRGVLDPNEKAAAKFALEHKCIKTYASLSELTADPEIKGVLVCNYSDQHYQTLVKLLSAGIKYIFCEKALVRKLDDGKDLLQRAEAAGAQIMVGHVHRYLPGCFRLRELIIKGELGTIRMAKVAYCHSGYNRKWGDFFSDFERSGGVTLDMMSHLFDQLNWYFGEPESVSGRSLMLDRSQPLPSDYVSGTLTYKNGVICNIDGSWQRYGVPYDRIEVYGDKACAVFDFGDKIHLYGNGIHSELMTGFNHTGQMEAFIAMITKGTRPRNTLQDGFNAVRVALKLIEAAEKKQTIYF
ncbi:MAG: Gfo/Idh/MocA family oxidoreductase [Kiritimatiellae bacterium]|nr:Gfo/Idh/MocA family oxidoreductase [Kiritimatiellia bacterium]MDD5519681.1 Gfo/Idh/MocA family oxidoreductase [Kiritimatiellia bacterium]